MQKIRIGVLVSGNGTNLQSIIDATKIEILSCAEVAVVISNKKDAFALKRAEQSKIESLFLDPKDFSSRSDYFQTVGDELKKREVSLICLAGFLLKCEPNLIRLYPNRIVNIHPSLLPKFGGKGMYGMRVHEAVIQAGEKESGCTVHLVDEEYDHGPVLLQRKVPVLSTDTVETLSQKVLKEEHMAYPEAVRILIDREFKNVCAHSSAPHPAVYNADGKT